MTRTRLSDIGWRLGRSAQPHGVELWIRYDRTTGVFGEQGSGKTLDILAPTLLAHPGAALVTLTKVEDLLLTIDRRRVPTDEGRSDRPVAVLDPFGTAPGLPPLVWDPVHGCSDPRLAERRAKAFAAGTIGGSLSGGRHEAAARFYAAETAKVLQGFLHAAALTGRSLEHLLDWVATPATAEQPVTILQHHPHAARFWDGLLTGALQGSSDTVANTVTTVQQAMSLFFQPAIRRRCVPSVSAPATDLAALIAGHGTVYLLGREDPYASTAPLMTAVAEDVLDTGLALAAAAPDGKLTPPFLACLDELPSTAPLPTLRVRMANERALGLSFLYATQTWKQLVVAYGEDEARALFGLTNTVVVYGGGKEVSLYNDLSALIDDIRITRSTAGYGPGGPTMSRTGEDAKILRPGDIRRLPPRHALVIAGTTPPMIARLRRCVDGRAGKTLLADLTRARTQMSAARARIGTQRDATAAAVDYSRTHHLAPADQPTVDTPAPPTATDPPPTPQPGPEQHGGTRC